MRADLQSLRFVQMQNNPPARLAMTITVSEHAPYFQPGRECREPFGRCVAQDPWQNRQNLLEGFRNLFQSDKNGLIKQRAARDTTIASLQEKLKRLKVKGATKRKAEWNNAVKELKKATAEREKLCERIDRDSKLISRCDRGLSQIFGALFGDQSRGDGLRSHHGTSTDPAGPGKWAQIVAMSSSFWTRAG